jgi:hypothetical protein
MFDLGPRCCAPGVVTSPAFRWSCISLILFEQTMERDAPGVADRPGYSGMTRTTCRSWLVDLLAGERDGVEFMTPIDTSLDSLS